MAEGVSSQGGLHALIDAYLSFAHLEQGLASNTLQAYSRDLARLGEFLESEGVASWRDLTRSHLSGFAHAMERAGLSARSRARSLAAVRCLLRFAARERKLAGDPVQGLANPKLPLRLPRVLAEDETRRLIEAAPDSALGLRDAAMLEVLYGAGLRVSELVGLPLAALDARSGLLRVLGKGQKERVVPIGEAALAALRRYLSAGRPALMGEHTDSSFAVFITRRGGPMTRQNFFTRLRSLARRAGIPSDRVSPHVLRHAFATDLLRGGADLRSIQAMLGHADLSTTEIYTHVDRSRLRKTIDARHPRARPDT
jgi:integrase/recombinase XerD